ncbi:MAG: hypothetical protein RUMPE_00033 [Eubacteriales bacterium SKADARSKE-1]|nr:hypothetical protein [Eubacteriales bacterium SKADARSKE-1]
MEENKKDKKENLPKKEKEPLKDDKATDISGGHMIYSPKIVEEEWIDYMHIPKD